MGGGLKDTHQYPPRLMNARPAMFMSPVSAVGCLLCWLGSSLPGRLTNNTNEADAAKGHTVWTCFDSVS